MLCFLLDAAIRRSRESTMSDYVQRILARWVPGMLSGDGVAIPDDPEEMNWRIFFASSQDMQGFRADIFTGGLNEETHPTNPAFRGLRERWPDSRSMIHGLASLWADEAAKQELLRVSNRAKPVPGGVGLALAVLRSAAGNEATHVFADALEAFKGYRIARTTNAMIRAYVQNASLLDSHHRSVRDYLLSIAGGMALPAAELVNTEREWVAAIAKDFYNVGPTLANYMICDWLLWLWREGKLGWFVSYKADSVFVRAVFERGLLPEAAVKDFVAYSQSLRLRPEWLPARLSHLAAQPLPPRILNEAIWMEENLSTPPGPAA